VWWGPAEIRSNACSLSRRLFRRTLRL